MRHSHGCCSKRLFAPCFSEHVSRLLEKGLAIPDIAISSPGPPLEAGFSLHIKQRAPIKGTRLRMILLLRHNANDDDKNNQRNHHADDDVHRLNRHLAL